MTLFKLPTPEQIAAKQLADTQRELLTAEAALEHWQSIVDMLEKRRGRLSERQAQPA